MKHVLLLLAFVASFGIFAVSQPPKAADAQPPAATPEKLPQGNLYPQKAAVKAVAFAVKESPVAAGSFAEVTLEGLTAQESAMLYVTPEPVKQVDHDATVYFSGLEKTYTVEAFVVNFETRKVYRKKVVVPFAINPQPPPTPEPKPKPDPDPQPVGKVTGFVIVEETSKAGAWRGNILGSTKVQSVVKSKSLRHLIIDADEPTESATVKAYQALAADKELPWVFLTDSAGKVLSSQKCPLDEDKFVALFGANEPRKMGLIPGKPRLAWKVFGEHANVPLIPRADWKPVNLKAFLPPVYDQDGRGQCNASATCTALEASAIMAGVPYPKLSAGDLYSLINDGRDQGSLLEDGIEAATKNGIATTKSVPYVWDGKRHNDAATVAERKQYLVVEAYLCPSFDAMGSALQQGFFIVHGLMWYDNFKVDKSGWLPARGTGNAGGHALCGYGIEQRNGVWGIRTRNSWSSTWGGSSDGTVEAGNCVIPESLFGRNITGYWAVRVVKKTNIDFPTPITQLNVPSALTFKRRLFDANDASRFVLSR